MDIELNPGPNMSDIKTRDIFHLNTRSIRKKIEYLNNIVDEFHILCFSETHLDNNIDSASMNIPGFDTPLGKDRTHNGRGVMIYMPSLLKYNRDLENPRLETIWAERNLKAFNVLLFRFYRSDFVASQSLFVSELQDSKETALDHTPNATSGGHLY